MVSQDIFNNFFNRDFLDLIRDPPFFTVHEKTGDNLIVWPFMAVLNTNLFVSTHTLKQLLKHLFFLCLIHLSDERIKDTASIIIPYAASFSAYKITLKQEISAGDKSTDILNFRRIWRTNSK